MPDTASPGPFLTKYELIAFLRQLPDDAVLVYAWTDPKPNHNTELTLTVESQEFPDVHESLVIPELDLPMSPARIAHEKLVPPFGEKVKVSTGRWPSSTPNPQSIPREECICDFEYTGLRQHKHNCPIYQKSISKNKQPYVIVSD